MNKKLVIVGVIALLAGALLSPVIGMAIGQTRSLILGLAPEDAVLNLADQIDANRATVDSKVTELQGLIDTQKSQIDEQNALIDSQKAELDKAQADIGSQKTEIVQVKNDTANNTACQKAQELYTKIPSKPKDACSTMGPSNIVDLYNAIKDRYNEYKGSNEKDGQGNNAGDCYKKYLDILTPAYNSYMSAKANCK